MTVVRHREQFAHDAPDEDWLQRAGENDWVVFTRDKLIRRRILGLNAVVAYRVRVLVIVAGNMTGPETVELILNSRAAIDRILRKNQPPLLAQISSAGVRLVDVAAALSRLFKRTIKK